jgi:hypothetical protein
LALDVTFLLHCLDGAWTSLTNPLNGILGISTKLDQQPCRYGASPPEATFTVDEDLEAVPKA